jgi:hypothetical protein
MRRRQLNHGELQRLAMADWTPRALHEQGFWLEYLGSNWYDWGRIVALLRGYISC